MTDKYINDVVRYLESLGARLLRDDDEYQDTLSKIEDLRPRFRAARMAYLAATRDFSQDTMTKAMEYNTCSVVWSVYQWQAHEYARRTGKILPPDEDSNG